MHPKRANDLYSAANMPPCASPLLLVLLLSAASLHACTRAPATGDGTAPPPVSAAPHASTLPATTPGVFARACEADCSDSLARLTVYRDAAGAIGVVTVQGSPSGCSHPPLRFFGPDGVERDAIPFVPVVPGSPEAKHFQEIHDRETANLKPAETMFCRDVKH